MSNRGTRQQSTDTDDRTAADYDPNPNERGRWVSALIALVGAWMLAEPLVLDLATAQFWNDIVAGLLLLAVGGYNFFRQSREEYGSASAAAIAALVGLWLVAAPFVFGDTTIGTGVGSDASFWNDVVVGLVALALGAYSAYSIRDRRSDRRAPA